MKMMSTGKIVLLAWGLYLVSTVSASIVDFAYAIHILYVMFAPALFAITLFVLSIARAHPNTLANRLRLHATYLPLLGFLIWQWFETILAYNAMNDAPRGLLLDFYFFQAFFVGLILYWGVWTAYWLIMKVANKAMQPTRLRASADG